MPAPTYHELIQQNERLKQELRQLQAENAKLREQLAQAQQTITQLTEQLAELAAALENAHRRGKRQAAPFSKGEPTHTPKRPGRKPGAEYGKHARRPPPVDQITEVVEAELPAACPHCGGDVEQTGVADQFQVDIPRTPIYRQFHVHVGRCQHCGQRVQGRHPLQTSDALGAAASQIGPDAQAAIGVLNKQAGLSHGKIESVMDELFGIDIARSTSVRIITRMGQQLAPIYETIGEAARASEVVTPDETGWRVGGKKAWLHVIANHDLAYYSVEPDRSSAFVERVLGSDWSGTMIHDGWSVYDNFTDVVHQQCVGHIMRRARDILETAPGDAVCFPRQVLDLFGEALALRDRFVIDPPSLETRMAAADRFAARLLRLTHPSQAYLRNEKLAAHLYRHTFDWFIFLIDLSVDATNWLAEQAIRPAVVNRKVWGGNRTWIGANAQSVITTVIQTCRKQNLSVLDFISDTLRGLAPKIFRYPLAAAR